MVKGGNSSINVPDRLSGYLRLIMNREKWFLDLLMNGNSKFMDLWE